MRYLVRTAVGLGLMTASIVAVSYAIYQLLQIGTCASGGPYVVARECPTGTERVALAIPVSVVVLLVGAGLYAARGAAPGSTRRGDPAIAIAILWSGLFLGIAFACFWGVWGPDANPGPGGKTGGLIVGFLFVPMGLVGVVPILAAAKSARAAREATGIGLGDTMRMARQARRADFGDLVERMRTQADAARASGAPTAPREAGASAVGGGDVLSRLERLQRLRETGAIDQAEFDRLKREVLG